ncbi:virulence RhuM family protein [Escherichia coli]|nr:cytoplasmic protein [Escherichia coli]EFK8607256.1 virulence RhuM family protein [Escherichia coli]PAZ61601.1 cytoplasmic protein [Escherichia coli]PAZ63569.1 cytoplasmic protein [Escherichia coli]PAZ84006.1 cytoplasmic protein [Escherichia coli]
MMDDERLKNPPVGSSVLERIRDIRASMRRVYLQVILPPLLTLSQLYRH